MLRLRSVCGALVVVVALSVVGPARPLVASGAGPGVGVTATLDGHPIPLKEVAKYFCDDFSFPVITCSTNAGGMELRVSALLQATAVDYVTIYDGATFSGAWMNVSQDYNALSFIGWNDRISSFKARNGQTGTFFLDWLYSGTSWAFCCNQQLGSLGSYDNNFSSIRRT